MAFRVSVRFDFAGTTLLFEVSSPRRIVHLSSTTTHMEHVANLPGLEALDSAWERARHAQVEVEASTTASARSVERRRKSRCAANLPRETPRVDGEQSTEELPREYVLLGEDDGFVALLGDHGVVREDVRIPAEPELAARLARGAACDEETKVWLDSTGRIVQVLLESERMVGTTAELTPAAESHAAAAARLLKQRHVRTVSA